MIKFYEKSKEITIREFIQDYQNNRKRKYIKREEVYDFDNFVTMVIDDIKIELTSCDKGYDGYSIWIETTYRQVLCREEVVEKQNKCYDRYYFIHSIEEFLDKKMTIIGEWIDEE